MPNKSYKKRRFGLMLKRVETDDKSDENYNETRNLKKFQQLSVFAIQE